MIHNFRIYKGMINNTEIMHDKKCGDTHYQKVRIDVTVTKYFSTLRFPLDSHQLSIFLELNMRCDEVILTPDTENSDINKSLDVSGYKITKNAVAMVPIAYNYTQDDSTLVPSRIRTVRSLRRKSSQMLKLSGTATEFILNVLLLFLQRSYGC